MSAAPKFEMPPPTEAVLAGLANLTPAALIQRRDMARRLVEDDGVVVGTDTSGQPQHLSIDPVPLVIEAPQWATLERGLAQRAELLDLLLDDIYGPRSLVAQGVVPPELVVGHPGFVPQADGIPTRHGLFLTAADLSRNAEGSWCVVADRTESPVGAGYAMAIRRITARALASLHREVDLRRLREFFDVMRTGLQEMATGTNELPRVVMLTPPEPEGVSTFDSVFTATLLGFPVVHAEELSMHGGRLWLSTTERPEPVDVLVRRLDAQRSDPLDLMASSEVGIPGLIEASRRGVVSVVNPIGAGVLESPALAAYLPAIARAVLGEDLILPSATTWWCGDPTQRRYVGAHLENLLLAPISPTPHNPRVFGGELSAADRAALWAQIEAQPWAWCAQEVLPLWSAPIVTDAGLSARVGMLRTFTLSDQRGTVVMPGGLARLAPQADDRHVPLLQKAIAKDVWVLSQPVATSPIEVGPGVQVPPALSPSPSGADDAIPQPASPVPLSPRSAEDLYWFGRYAERAESTARLVLVADDLVEDNLRRPGTSGFEAMRVVMDALDAVTSVHRYRSGRPDKVVAIDQAGALDPVPHLHTLVFDSDRPGTVRYSARRAARAAAQVREVLSMDTWLVLSRLDRSLASDEAASDQLQSVLGMVLESFLAIAGMGAEGLVRDASWAFFDAGRRVERGQETVRVLHHTIGSPRSPHVDRQVIEAVLRSRESLISHRRRTAETRTARESLEIALDLLLVDPTNPRSVAYQLDRLREDLAYAPSSRVTAALASPTALLSNADTAAMARDRAHLAAYLIDLETQLRTVSATLDATSFRHRAPAQVVEEPR